MPLFPFGVMSYKLTYLFSKESPDQNLLLLLNGIYKYNFISKNEGAKVFVQLIKTGIKHPSPYFYIAQIFYSRGDYELCKKYHELALSYKEYSYSIINVHESIYFRLSQYNNCLSGIESAIKYTQAAIEYHKDNINEAMTIFRNTLFNINREHIGILDEKKLKVFRFRSSSDENIKTLMNDCLWFSDLNFYNDSFEGELITIYESQDPFHELLKKFKACCFFGAPKGFLDSRMWDLYANKSDGFCVEYEIDLSKISQTYNVYIDYITYSNRYYQDIASLHWMLHNCFFRKASEWKNEREIRILFFDEIKRNGIEIDSSIIGIKIKNIYFGRKISKNKIKSIYDHYKDKGIGLFLVKTQESSFNLCVKKCDISL